MQQLGHPNIMRLHAVVDDKEAEGIYLILPFAEKGALMEWDVRTQAYISATYEPTASGGKYIYIYIYI